MRKRTWQELEYSEEWAKIEAKIELGSRPNAREKVEQNYTIFLGERKPVDSFHPPQSRFRRFCNKFRRLGPPVRLAGLMCVNYGLIAVSIRMLQKGSYLGLGISDGAVACWGFMLIKQVVKAETVWEQIGYTIGGIAGSLVGLWVTK